MAMVNRGLLLFLFIGFITIPSVQGSTVSGIVINEELDPFKNAQIYIYHDGSKIASGTTNNEGEFLFSDLPGTFEIVVYADLNSTLGVDYLPYRQINSNVDKLQINLTPAASIYIEGTVQFIDSEKLPLETFYNIQDINNNILNPSGMPLIFTSKGISKIPILTPGHLIVPINTQIILNVNSSVLVNTNVVEKREINSIMINTPEKGEAIIFDIREISLPTNLRIANKTIEQLIEELMRMDEYGFFLTKEHGTTLSSKKLLKESYSLYQNKSYTDTFYSLKQSYMMAESTLKALQRMYNDARASITLLIGFLIVSSLITGYLISEKKIIQFFSGFTFTASSLLLFYHTYPGSKIITLNMFIRIAAPFYIFIIIFGNISPKIFTKVSVSGRIRTRYLILPILNIAKRSLRRRKISFLLTLVSIILLVMSFVTLTSFSEGYGLVETRFDKKVEWRGVYIRDGSWTQHKPTFLPFNEIETNWIYDQSEIILIYPKAQNIPQYSCLNTLEGEPICGVIGIASSELGLINLSSAIIQGTIPDDKGISISNNLLEKIEAEFGETITFGFKNFTIQGVFDDTVLKSIKDLDGEPYLPNKWIDINPRGDPVMVLQTCDPSEVVFLNTQNALQIPSTGIQRIALELKKDIDLQNLAKRLSLERGYRSYVSTTTELILFRIGNYFEARGLSLVIPWVIVVLNVIITMLNNLYERRNEIKILSSVGLNPAQISGIFLAEATIIGFIAGGIGYLVGLVFYRGMTTLKIGLHVLQKVSAVWSFASVGLSISAVLTGAIVSLKSSVVITPSLTRKWKMDKKEKSYEEIWRITVPIKLETSEVEPYLNYIYLKLKKMEDNFVRVTSSIKLMESENGKKLFFIYKSVGGSTGNFYTRNELFVDPTGDNKYGVHLESLGNPESAHIVGSLIRRITMDFSSE
jgi:ABC-type antimicrobial peptide transport system permease subunit